MNRRKLLVIVFAVAFPICNMSAQGTYQRAFEEFSKMAEDDFYFFSDSLNTVFTESLQNNWERFHLENGVERSDRVKPERLPVVSPGDVVTVNEEIPVLQSVVWEEPMEIPSLKKWFQKKSSGVRVISFPFYETMVNVRVPDRYGAFHPAGISEADVAAFWKELASCDFGVVLSDCQGYCASCGINDWAVLEWVQALAVAMFPDNLFSEQIVFSVFLLNQMGYNVRMARSGKELFCLFSAGQNVFSRKFIVLGSCRYYVAGECPKESEIFTYRTEFSDISHPLDLHIRQSVFYRGHTSYTVVSRYSGVLEKEISITLSRPLLSFYDSYPQVDLEVYATAVPDRHFENAFDELLLPVLDKMTSQEKIVNLFLEFLQKDFKYKTDKEQFGHEKPFFSEECFVYEYNDCEDRVALLSFLVRHYLGLKMVLLDYGDHVAAAINFTDTVTGDYIVWNSGKYYVCDPTYLGARTGMSIPRYRQEKVKVIALE